MSSWRTSRRRRRLIFRLKGQMIRLLRACPHSASQISASILQTWWLLTWPPVCMVVTTPLRRPLPRVLHRVCSGSQLQMPTHPSEPAVVKAPATMTCSSADELAPDLPRCVMARTDPAEELDVAKGRISKHPPVVRKTHIHYPRLAHSAIRPPRPAPSYRSSQTLASRRQTTTLDRPR